jgi:hypothetical protein
MKRSRIRRLILVVMLMSALLSMAVTPGHAATLAYQALGGSFIGSPVSIATTNRVDTFIVGTDHALYHKTLTPSGWQPANGFEKIGGYILGKPAAIYGPNNRIDVFVVGSDHALYHTYYDGTAWQPFENLGGYVVGNPTALRTGTQSFDVFVLGADHAVYHKSYNGHAWFPSKQSYEDLGGYSLSDPIAVSWGRGRIDLFVVGTDYALYHKYTSNLSTWLPSESGYENLGGIIAGQPSVIAPSYGRLDVFIVGNDQALYHKYFNEYSTVGWQPSLHGFENLGGHLSGTPVATDSPYATPGEAGDALYVVAKGTDTAVYDKHWDGANWQPSITSWEYLGGIAVGDVSAVGSYFNYQQQVDLFVIGTDHGLYHKFEVNNAWYSLF